MNKKIISILLVSVLSSLVLISCGQSNTESTTSNSSSATSSESNSSNDDKPIQNSKIMDNPTVEVNQIVSLSDFKGKDSNSIKSVLGDPISENNNVSTYKKDAYTFEVTYYDSICGQIKIIPDTEMKFPADATISLKALGITAGNSDELSPTGLTWNNQYDTYSIKVVPDEKNADKVGSIQIILDEKYK